MLEGKEEKTPSILFCLLTDVILSSGSVWSDTEVYPDQ